MDLSKLLNNARYEIEVVKAKGHKNIKALHKTTFEITRESHLTPRGDCIIGVKANKAASDFNNNFKKLAKSNYSVIIIILRTSNYTDIIVAHGNNKLMYEDETRIIVRKSTYVDGATIAIRSSKAARDIDRKLIEDLRNEQELETLFIVLSFDNINAINELIRSIIKYRGNPFNNPVI